MRCTLQDVFRQHYEEFAAGRQLHPRQTRAAHCISNCYTQEFGAHLLACPQGHFAHVQYHACRHRSCPRCAPRGIQDWVDAQLAALLPSAHYHVIFTVPHELLKLWEFNRSRMTQLLFDCARLTLLELLDNPKHLGAMPGLLMSLHTWGRTLSRHPHVHCLLSAGGIDAQGRWQDCASNYLVPLKPLRLLFRGKMLGELGKMLTANELTLPPTLGQAHWRQTIKALYQDHWNIQVCAPYTQGRGVALYLSRYVKGGPLPKDRPLYMGQDGTVRFSYTDHRDGRVKTMCLSALQFIERVLWHSPPRGQHTVRRAGLYASAHRQQHASAHRQQHASAMQQLAQRAQPGEHSGEAPPMRPQPCPNAAQSAKCPSCNRALLWVAIPRMRHQEGEFSQEPSEVVRPPTPPPLS